jgi:hypothetical protein
MRVNDPIQGIFFSADHHIAVKKKEIAPRKHKLVML